jgi:hypothetical protein
MISRASPALQAKLTGSDTMKAGRERQLLAAHGDAIAFEGTAIQISAATLDRWKAAYRHIDDWPAALQAIDDFCASILPADNAKQISRASSWLERRNHQNRKDSNETIRLEGRSF